MYEIAVVWGAGFVFSVVSLLASLNDVLISIPGSHTSDSFLLCFVLRICWSFGWFVEIKFG